MRQRISVRAVIHKQGGHEVMLLRRSTGRESILGHYELPGGKIGYREQPDDALARYLHDDAGLVPREITLRDVFTYTDRDDPALQYVFIVYDVKVMGESAVLSRNYDHMLWSLPSKTQRKALTESTRLLLSIASHPSYLTNNNVAATTDRRVVVYTDGGSRGNPGPSAAGYVIYEGDVLVRQGGKYLGRSTNNVAEYVAALLGLESALDFGAQVVDFRMDSLLVVNQLNGLFKIRNRELGPLHESIKLLENRFKSVRYVHVRRNFNAEADGIVNRILDDQAAGRADLL